MDFYFDFEATQFNENIIAIGATCEYGSFDCLVRPPKGDKVTKFITDLTGITPEMAETALSLDEAFFDLWVWMAEAGEYNGCPSFYHVFGNMDKVFLERAIPHINNPVIQEFVQNLSQSLVDDSRKVSKFFHMKTIGVSKALHYFEPDFFEQDHDPLNDAIMLKVLVDHVDKAEPLEDCPFNPPAQQPKSAFNQMKKCKVKLLSSCFATKGKNLTFNTLEAALSWAVNKIQKNNPEAVRKNIKKNVQKAVMNKGNYLGYQWIVG